MVEGAVNWSCGRRQCKVALKESESLFKGRWPMSVGSFLQADYRSYNIRKSRVPVAGVSSRRGLTESKYVAQLLSLGLKIFNEGSFSSRA